MENPHPVPAISFEVCNRYSGCVKTANWRWRYSDEVWYERNYASTLEDMEQCHPVASTKHPTTFIPFPRSCSCSKKLNSSTHIPMSRFLQIFMCLSGSAADTQNLCAYVQYYLHQHCMDMNREADVKTAAKLAKLIAYNNKVRPLGSPVSG